MVHIEPGHLRSMVARPSPTTRGPTTFLGLSLYPDHPPPSPLPWNLSTSYLGRVPALSAYSGEWPREVRVKRRPPNTRPTWWQEENYEKR